MNVINLLMLGIKCNKYFLIFSFEKELLWIFAGSTRIADNLKNIPGIVKALKTPIIDVDQ